MNILIAPDSFKESLTALQVANAIEIGFKHIFKQATYQKVPMADGGEGTVQSLVDATQGTLLSQQVTAPLGNKIQAVWGLSGDKQTAFIEMAAASGLHLVPPAQRNPLITTSYGTGELIKAALDYGVNNIILGIGGSATNDGGVGMLQALGIKFTDQQQRDIGFGGQALMDIAHIDLSQCDPRLQYVQLEVACDVNNPLCGEQGASAIFAPQKGASPAMIKQLDLALQHFAQMVQQHCQLDILTPAGAGAAGGMGGGLLLLPQVTLKSGVEIVINAVNLAEKIKQADLVITGEGRMDAQSIHGKTPIGVANIAKQFNKPVIALVGSLKSDYPLVYNYGIDAVFPIIRQVADLTDTLAQAEQNLISTAHNVARLYQLAQGHYSRFNLK
ncbi:glycerate kinase [Volucribacter amazonae]|uniref:Glycerate kinase n=1 Tax=Volucribacter amazonae TaxID=256731 RepID=A0A9X4PBC6_9PAST|nr:glycerate kinase [Volucribacter amazonae]MDG6896015.1 glycerate kinase [Volucribacter amazonae]